MTDKEIIKAFEICRDGTALCQECPCFIKDEPCICSSDNDIDTVLSLIKHQKAEIERLTEELKNLDWYKMWHKKHKQEIDDLTLELETYRPTKLSGNGQCKCSNCGNVNWTDFGFSSYKRQTLCNKCLKEITQTEKQQTVKDTAKEMLQYMETLKVEEDGRHQWRDEHNSCIEKISCKIQQKFINGVR